MRSKCLVSSSAIDGKMQILGYKWISEGSGLAVFEIEYSYDPRTRNRYNIMEGGIPIKVAQYPFKRRWGP